MPVFQCLPVALRRRRRRPRALALRRLPVARALPVPVPVAGPGPPDRRDPPLAVARHWQLNSPPGLALRLPLAVQPDSESDSEARGHGPPTSSRLLL